jgi:hypothetical protein
MGRKISDIIKEWSGGSRDGLITVKARYTARTYSQKAWEKSGETSVRIYSLSQNGGINQGSLECYAGGLAARMWLYLLILDTTTCCQSVCQEGLSSHTAIRTYISADTGHYALLSVCFSGRALQSHRNPNIHICWYWTLRFIVSLFLRKGSPVTQPSEQTTGVNLRVEIGLGILQHTRCLTRHIRWSRTSVCINFLFQFASSRVGVASHECNPNVWNVKLLFQISANNCPISASEFVTSSVCTWSTFGSIALTSQVPQGRLNISF